MGQSGGPEGQRGLDLDRSESPGQAEAGPRSAARRIADQIRNAVARGDLEPGERLPGEHELAASFDVARGTVREALRTLSAGGLVRSSRGSGGGTFVTIPDADWVAEQLSDSLGLWFQVGDISLAEVNEARAVLERACVQLAAQHRTEDDLAHMRQAVERSRAPGITDDEFITSDIDFHSAVSNAAKNRVLGLAMSAVHLVRPRTNRILLDKLDKHAIADQHWAMYISIRDQRPDLAALAFEAHIEHLHEVQRTALADSDPRNISVVTADPDPS